MQTIYENGTLLTLTEQQPSALLVRDGKIEASGDREALSAMAPEAAHFDLEGATLLPAFLDAHSHFTACANALLQVQLAGASSFSQLREIIQRFIAEHCVAPGEWVSAQCYDSSALEENAHPPRTLLDEAAPENPLILQHFSGHSGLCNSLALKRLGINCNTPSPAGGRIAFEGGEPTGYLEEAAYFTAIRSVPVPSGEKLFSAFLSTQSMYASYGIATAQEGMMVKEILPLYRELIARRLLKIDLVGYASLSDYSVLRESFPRSETFPHFRLGGIKIFLDGSPQCKTAWMREPYFSGEPGDCGYGTMSQKEVEEAVVFAAKKGEQLLAHCNGDAAAEQFLNALCLLTPEERLAMRPVMIHAQLLGRDQLETVRRLGVIPSFFVAHVKYLGDQHVQNFGERRASVISPAGSAARAGIRFTFHQDSPVFAPNMLETVQCAVERKTASGRILGAEEAVSPLAALRAVTSDAAYQYFEEGRKGTLAPGGRADFVILSKNPLLTPTEEISQIRVLHTIKDDVPLYTRH